MALRTNLLPQPSLNLKPQNPTTFLGSRAESRIRCSSESRVGDTVALSLTREVAKRKALLAKGREALEKSRDILFRELCLHLSMEAREVRAKWRAMGEDDKLVLVRGFVSRWAHNFHPLSVRSVKELVDEELLGHHQENDDSNEDSSSSS